MALHEEQITCPYCWESITPVCRPPQNLKPIPKTVLSAADLFWSAPEVDGEFISVQVTQEDLGF